VMLDILVHGAIPADINFDENGSDGSAFRSGVPLPASVPDFCARAS
jgi:hypothetical protein